MGIETAIEELAACRGILYDPAVVDACLDIYRCEGQKGFLELQA
jgi:response regulator RpfG family c-di-GMP phosphodiesterase